MTSHHQQIKLMALAIAVTTAIALVACTEKAADSNQTEKVVSTTVLEDKIAQLQREAQAGDPDAQYELAYLYENGLGVPKSETKALELYQQAADQGHPAAQDNFEAISKSK
jgi:TPR repeat protein